MRTGWIFMISLTGNIQKGQLDCGKQQKPLISHQKAAP